MTKFCQIRLQPKTYIEFLKGNKMQWKNDKEKLLDAMVLLEVANKMYPSTVHFFSKYSTSDLITAAHDLIQNVHSDDGCPFNDQTHEVVATLEGARRYMDMGGHLWQPREAAEQQAELVGQPQGMWARIFKRFALK